MGLCSWTHTWQKVHHMGQIKTTTSNTSVKFLDKISYYRNMDFKSSGDCLEPFGIVMAFSTSISCALSSN